jgi:hypothetical protein
MNMPPTPETSPPNLTLAIDERVARTTTGGVPLQSVSATLRNDHEEAVTDVTIWFKSNQGPIALHSAESLEPGETIRGFDFIADGERPDPALLYASARSGGQLWRVNENSDPISAREPVPPPHEDLPDQLPSDIGSSTYVRAWGMFRRAEDIDLDDVEPTSDYVERQALTRRVVSNQLSSIHQTNHFLFGTPGVQHEPDRFLYHYTTTETLRLIADTRKLRLGPFRTKNDPREARAWTNLPLMTSGRRVGQGPTDEDKVDAQPFVAGVDTLRLGALMLSLAKMFPSPTARTPGVPSLPAAICNLVCGRSMAMTTKVLA